MFQFSLVTMSLVQDFICVSLCIDLRRRLWDQALRFTTLGDSNRWRGSNKYSDLLTRSIYSTVLQKSRFYFCWFWNQTFFASLAALNGTGFPKAPSQKMKVDLKYTHPPSSKRRKHYTVYNIVGLSLFDQVWAETL